MAVTIIGIDCATKDNKIGLALGHFDENKAYIDKVIVGSRETPVVETVVDWMGQCVSALLAVDAPLGWPVGLVQALCFHEAGGPIQLAANEMFRRLTDREIKRKIGKQPLDVGADKIARTARAALRLLQDLRARTGKEIPLAWKPCVGSRACVIEVYPAATLAAYGVKDSGYKGKEGRVARQAILEFLGKKVGLPKDTALMESKDDALDAALCVLAGVDFLRGEVLEPTEIPVVKREGWIWVRKPNR